MAKKTEIEDLDFTEDEGVPEETLPSFDDADISATDLSATGLPDEGPAGEEKTLDKYGVWVKVQPEEIEGGEPMDEKDMELEDLSFDEEPKTGSKKADSMDELDVAGVADVGDVADMEIGAVESLDLPEEEPFEALSLDEEIPAAEGTADDFSLEEESPPMEELADLEESADAEAENLDEIPAEPVARNAASGVEEAGDFEEISLDDLGIELSEEEPVEKMVERKDKVMHSKAQADVVQTESHEDDFPELSLDLDEKDSGDSGANGKVEATTLRDEEDELELSLGDEEELTPASGDESFGASEIEESTGLDSFEDLPDLDAKGDEEIISLEDEEIEVPLSEDITIADAEEELKDVEEGMHGVAEGVAATDAGLNAAESGINAAGSSAILAKIEQELRSIKSELSSLKKELGTLRQKAASGGGKTAQKSEDGEASFFEEEEDETIALTGEELDNILTTADIREEGKAEGIAEETQADEVAPLSNQEDILGYDELESLDQHAPKTGGEDDLSIELDEEAASEPDLLSDDEEIEIEIPAFDDKTLSVGDEEVISLEPDEDGIEDLGASLDNDIESLETEPLEDFGDSGVSDLSLDELSPEETVDELSSLSMDEEPAVPSLSRGKQDSSLPPGLKEEIKSVLSYMDQLLEALPEEKIEEFAKSEYFSVYKKLFEELGLVS